MKKFVLFAAILVCISLCPMSAWAAAPSIEWEKYPLGAGENDAYSIWQTSDGGYIVAGSTWSNNGEVPNNGGRDVWVAKLDASGAIQWQKCFGGSKDDYASSIQQTSDGGYIFAGRTNSNNGDVSGHHYDYDAWVVKLDESGVIEWQKCLGGDYEDGAYSIQQTGDGGYIVAGFTCSHDGDVLGLGNHGKSDAWVVKLDESGIIEWQKCLGGSDDDFASSIQQTSDGGYIVAGYTFSKDGDFPGNHGVFDAWVAKLDESGASEWRKCLGGPGNDFGYSIQQTSDGGYILAGYTDSDEGDVFGNHGEADAWVVKLDESGAIEWQKCLGGTGYDSANAIQQTSDGGYILAGYTDSDDGDVSGNHGGRDAWVVKLDESGAIEWGKCLGGTGYDFASSIQQTRDGGYIVAGYTRPKDGNFPEYYSAWVVKLASAGNTTTLKVSFQGRAEGSEANIENLTVKWIEGGKATDIGPVTTDKDGTAEITLSPR